MRRGEMSDMNVAAYCSPSTVNSACPVYRPVVLLIPLSLLAESLLMERNVMSSGRPFRRLNRVCLALSVAKKFWIEITDSKRPREMPRLSDRPRLPIESAVRDMR